MDLDDAIREGWRIIDEAMRQELAEAPKPLMRYLRKCEWDVLQVELAKRESPLHQYIALDKDCRLTCCGVELRRLEFIETLAESAGGPERREEIMEPNPRIKVDVSSREGMVVLTMKPEKDKPPFGDGHDPESIWIEYRLDLRQAVGLWQDLSRHVLDEGMEAEQSGKRRLAELEHVVHVLRVLSEADTLRPITDSMARAFLSARERLALRAARLAGDA